MFHDLEEVIELIEDGGIQVITLLPEIENTILSPSSSLSEYKGKVFDRQGIRTFIQFDSDYVTMLSPIVLSMPELLKRHHDAVHTKLYKLQRILRVFRFTWVLLIIVFEGFSFFKLYGFIDEQRINLEQGILVSIAMVLGGALIICARTRLAHIATQFSVRVVRYYARYRLRKFFACARLR